MPKYRCPQSPHHEKFTADAHVVERWVIDENGNFLEHVAAIQVIRQPDADGDDEIKCVECNSIAIKET